MDTSVPLNPNDLFSASGLVIILTDGGSATYKRIGLAIASVVRQTGTSRFYILGRRLSALKEAARSIGSPAIPVECDVTKLSSVSVAVAKVEQEVGYVDVLINNAGVPGPDNMAANTAETIEELQSILLGSPGGWESTFAINTSALRRKARKFQLTEPVGAKRELRLGDQGIALDDQMSSLRSPVADFGMLYIFPGKLHFYLVARTARVAGV